MRLDGRTAIVTGAANGVGLAICLGLAGEGAAVWGCDMLGPELEETRRAVDAAGARPGRAAVVDVRDADAVRAFVTRAEAESGRVDVLVNTAGGVAGQLMERRHHERCVAWRRPWRGHGERDITAPYRSLTMPGKSSRTWAGPAYYAAGGMKLIARSASAQMVSAGLTPGLAETAEPSTT